MSGRRYETLDALRGVAAFAIVIYHLGQMKLESALVPHGYLAVDFFFILSGFVVANAYEGPLLGGMTWRAFMIKRVIRLWPLAALGAVMGLVVLLMKYLLFPAKVDTLPRILLSGFFNTAMLPTFFGGIVSERDLFPGNGPLWSLFFELCINLLWAWFGIRLKTCAIAAVSAVSALILFALTFHFHTVNLGWNVASLWGGGQPEFASAFHSGFCSTVRATPSP